MRVRHLDGAAALEAPDWDRCFPADYPFTRHAFLSALEACGCVTPATGWTPCHAVLEDAHTVRLATGEKITAKYVLIATGGAPTSRMN